MDMKYLASENRGFKNVLIAIDVFSRYAFCQPAKSKAAKDVLPALQKLFSGPRIPRVIRTDKGREFNNKNVSTFLDDRGIRHFTAQNTETKANYVERLIKTIKHRLYRYFIKNRTQTWTDILPNVTLSYNHTLHSSLGRAPASVSENNEHESRYEQHIIRQKRPSGRNKKEAVRRRNRRFAFKLGQVVRVTHVRNVFDREYSQKWTGELLRSVADFGEKDFRYTT